MKIWGNRQPGKVGRSYLGQVALGRQGPLHNGAKPDLFLFPFSYLRKHEETLRVSARRWESGPLLPSGHRKDIRPKSITSSGLDACCWVLWGDGEIREYRRIARGAFRCRILQDMPCCLLVPSCIRVPVEWYVISKEAQSSQDSERNLSHPSPLVTTSINSSVKKDSTNEAVKCLPRLTEPHHRVHHKQASSSQLLLPCHSWGLGQQERRLHCVDSTKTVPRSWILYCLREGTS